VKYSVAFKRAVYKGKRRREGEVREKKRVVMSLTGPSPGAEVGKGLLAFNLRSRAMSAKTLTKKREAHKGGPKTVETDMGGKKGSYLMSWGG